VENISISPPVGIQNTHIALTRVGNANFLYGLNGNHRISQLSGAGTSIDKDMAKQFSEYEAIERVANAINCRKIVVETAENLGDKAVDMSKFPKLSSDEDSMNINFSLNQTYSWVKCIDLYTLDIKMVPANFVYLFQDKNFYGDKITSPISTGAALHENYISAIINGIYEVIERDSIALTWLLKNVKGEVSHLFSDEEKRVFDSPFLGEVKFYDTSTVDGITTICAHAKSNYSENCKNVLMFCSSINISDIKKKLWKELISVMFSFYTNEYKYDSSTDYSNFVRVDQGGAYMAKIFNDSHFDFFKTVPVIETAYQDTLELSKGEELRYLINILKKEKFTVYITDISCREVLERNYRAVKVIIPEAQPISFVYRSRYLGSDRFVRLAKDKYGKDYKKYINNMPLAFS
jgi:ribosomal protein S12 methylthiotransferase accessory factor